MTYETILQQARDDLRRAHAMIIEEIGAYPTPIAGCDAQYNHLIGQRHAIADALKALEQPGFVPTPRMLEPVGGIESR